MGLLWDTPEERNRKERAKAARGLLGKSAQPQVLGELGRFTTQLQQAKQGSGLRGSPSSPEAQQNFLLGAMQAGIPQNEAINMMQTGQLEQVKPTNLMQNLTAAGVNLDTSAGQKTMLGAIMKPQTQINMGAGAGTMWTPEQVKQAGLPVNSVVTEDRYGKPQILSKEKYTQPQILSGTYAARMNDATVSIDKIMAGGFDPSGVMQNIDQFGIPNIAANYMRTPEGQQYRQAQENWISANLRKESGAAIPEQEMDREIKKWFPYPGDANKVIVQKSESRKTAERGMQKAAGGSYQELLDKADSDRLSELRGKHGAK